MIGMPKVILLRRRLENPEGPCLVPLTEFCERTPGTHDVGGRKPITDGTWWKVDIPVLLTRLASQGSRRRRVGI